MTATTLAATTADDIALHATQAPATDQLTGDPAPTRRQVAAVLRTFADHTHNAHMVEVCTDPTGPLQPTALSDYLHALAHATVTNTFTSHASLTVAGKHAAQRIREALQWGRGDLDLRDEPRPSPGQVATILTAMAAPKTLPTALASHEVYELGANRDQFGARWQRTTGIGRFFHALADHIADTETYNQA